MAWQILPLLHSTLRRITMAFNVNPAPAAASVNDSWKATAFLNIFVKKGDGTRTKVGAIPLKQSRKLDAALIHRLQEDGATDAMLKVLELDFQLVDDGKQTDLPF